MSRRLVVSLLAGTLSSLGCGPSLSAQELDAEAVASRQDEIIGGTVVSQGLDMATVAMTVRYGGGYQSLCTGTLIGPKTVLTAAHCIYSYGQNAPYYVAFGTNASAPTKAVQITAQYAHPSYNGNGYDFGILRLATPVLDVQPIPMNEEAMTSALVGRAIRHVGYGITSPSGSGGGTKREVTYNLRGVQSLTIESGATGRQTCQGDSGGPGFMVMPGGTREVLVGVVSYGDQDCAYQGYDGRVDKVVPWVRQTMIGWETPTCATDGACVQNCMTPDQDCACAQNGICGADCVDPSMDFDCPRDCAANNVCAQQTCGRPDPDCVQEGQICSAAVQCRERLCVSDRQNPLTYCTKGCAANADCPSNMECATGTCRIRQRPERQFLDSCFPSSDYCVEGLCTGPVGGIARCVKGCLVTADCGAGSVCEAGADSQRYCRPNDLRFTNVVLPARPVATGPIAEGCSAAGGSWLWALGALVPLLRRRRAS